MSTGAPQGSLLGPRLFSIAANNLPDLSNLFVDDTTAKCVGDTMDTLFEKDTDNG